MLRKWLVEETGEVRRVGGGEFFLGNDDLFCSWKGGLSPTVRDYPILRITEITRPEGQGLDNFDEWNW